MISFRSPLLLSFAAFFVGATVSAQQPLFQVQQPTQSPQAGQQRVQQPPIQVQPIQQQRVQQQPMQPFVVQGGQSVYQPNPQQPQPTAQPAGGQTPIGTNFGQQPPRVATTQPGQPAAGQSIQLYNPSGMNQTPQILQPGVQGAQQGIPPGMQHMGSAAPASRIVPFWLNPDQQRELDAFLERWETYSATINRYEVNFELYLYDPTIPGPEAEPNKPHKIAFGYFKYNASPRRFVYEVEGEVLGGKPVKRTDNTPGIYAEKIIIDEKTVYKYDYNAKTVLQINVPPELIGRGIADSPLPLIFGAKAEDLKRRFSMKIEPYPNRDHLMILQAKPLLMEDQQEFKELEIFIDRRSLTAVGLRQWDINEKTYRTFSLNQPQLNGKDPVLEVIKRWFTAEVPRGWRLEEQDWVAPPPPPAPAMQQPRIALPPLSPNEVPLYRM